MHRLGVTVEELPKLCEAIKECENIRIEGCYSHLSEPNDSVKTEEQYANFVMAKNITNKYFSGVIFHLSASGGILLNKKFHFDMVRAGLLLYGYKPFPSNVLRFNAILVSFIFTPTTIISSFSVMVSESKIVVKSTSSKLLKFNPLRTSLPTNLSINGFIVSIIPSI